MRDLMSLALALVKHASQTQMTLEHLVASDVDAFGSYYYRFHFLRLLPCVGVLLGFYPAHDVWEEHHTSIPRFCWSEDHNYGT
jgi:hypothetical protein